MAEGKKSFTAYCNWIDTFDELTDEEAGRLIKHLFNYVNDKNPEAPDKLTKIAFMEIKNTLKRDLTKWVAKAESNRINGSKGGRPRKQEETEKTQSVNLGLENNPQKPVTVKVTVTDNVKDKVNDIIKESKVYQKEVHDCYNNCLDYFPIQLHPKNEITWLDTIEKLNRIEKLPFDFIVDLVSKIRNDDFWSKNFLSILKLRKKNKDGLMYVIYFNEYFNKTTTKKSFEDKFKHLI